MDRKRPVAPETQGMTSRESIPPETSDRGGEYRLVVVLTLGLLVLVASAVLVVVVIPNMQEHDRQVRSADNVRHLATMLVLHKTTTGRWPPYSGKNFVLSLVATGQIDRHDPHSLAILFSGADNLTRLERVDIGRYALVTAEALANGTDFSDLTSYAGRRNAEEAHRIAPGEEKEGTILLCDDDDGALHHREGIVVGYSDGTARFLTWSELGLPEPQEPDVPEPFLGKAAVNEHLAKVSSR